MMNDLSANYTRSSRLREYVLGDGSDSLEVVLHRLFLALRFKNKLLGTYYLKEALTIRYGMPQYARVSLTREIYPMIAGKLSSTVDRVERAIRNAITDCHNHGNLLAFNEVVRCQVVSAKYVPTNGEFISNVVSWLHLEYDKTMIATQR